MLRIILLSLWFVSTAAFAEMAPKPMPWFQVTQLFFSPLQVRMWGPASYADPYPWTGLYYRGGNLTPTNDPYPSPELQSGVPYTMDLTPFGVGSDATIAFLSGILIISMDDATLGEMRITFAPHASPPTIDCTRYIGQAVSYNVFQGEVRSNMATFVPLNGGKFDFCIIKGGTGDPIMNASYGINLTLQMWGR